MSIIFIRAGMMLWASIAVAIVAVPVQGASVVDSVHNLSMSGPGAVKATAQTEICIFCHTPHNARANEYYLWNRLDPAGPYTPYGSSTLKASVGQPTGTSRLCLSCHDGTIALGAVLSRTAVMPFTMSLSGRNSNLGTNLADDHPVSFDYSAAALLSSGQLVNAGSLPSVVRLDSTGQMQCTACHNPHNDQYGKFLAISNVKSALCTTCHSKINWSTNSHATSPKTWNGSGPDPWPSSSYTTVADNACGNCHRPHSASGNKRLLNDAVETANCLICHSGTVAAKNVYVDLQKAYTHPVGSNSGIHDAAENYSGVVSHHVECVDCHNPHQGNATTTTTAPAVPGVLKGVSAVTKDNTYLASATYEYEICFKCHGSLLNNVMASPSYPRVIPRVDNRVKFATTNKSFHPLMGSLNKISDNMLISPWVKGSIMYCTDCHGSDSSGLRGSHGSIYNNILVKKYNTSETPPAVWDSAEYALCFKCHNYTTLTGSFTKFKKHRTHLETHAKKDRCVYCHDPHGSPENEGMINFDTRVVSKNGTKAIEFKWNITASYTRNSCVLVCHGLYSHG